MTTQQDSADVERLRTACMAAGEILEDYIGFLHRMPASELEAHPYIPTVQDAYNQCVAALSLPITQRDEQGDQAGNAWKAPSTAPKDGTVLELAVDYAEGHSPLQDATVACTIGWNDLENTGVDKWHIVGWDWCHDHIRDGAGTIRAWRPSRLMACDDALPPLPQNGDDK